MNFILISLLIMSFVNASSASSMTSSVKVDDKPKATQSLESKMKLIEEVSGKCFESVRAMSKFGDFSMIKFLPALVYFSGAELQQRISNFKNRAGENCSYFESEIDTFLYETETKVVAIDDGSKKCSSENPELKRQLDILSQNDFDPAFLLRNFRTLDFTSKNACQEMLTITRRINQTLQQENSVSP